ncbi:MAG: hypothetical protein AABW81_02540 [Nanoarchaeota archaeon]
MIKITSEFFDLFGIICFLYITIFSAYFLKINKKPEKLLLLILLFIGVLGLIVDGTIVYINFIK